MLAYMLDIFFKFLIAIIYLVYILWKILTKVFSESSFLIKSFRTMRGIVVWISDSVLKTGKSAIQINYIRCSYNFHQNGLK